MRKKSAAAKVAYPAILVALAVALVYLASILPTGSWGIVAAAGLLPAAAVISVGTKAGALCWAGASILSLLVAPDKFCALLFTVLFGPYPIVKSLAEGPRKKLLEYAVKLAFFNAALTVLYLTMTGAMLAALPRMLGGAVWLLYLVGNIVFLAYDRGSSRLIAVYIRRIGGAVH